MNHHPDWMVSIDEAMALAYQRGLDIATARAENRIRLGLPLDRYENIPPGLDQARQDTIDDGQYRGS